MHKKRTEGKARRAAALLIVGALLLTAAAGCRQAQEQPTSLAREPEMVPLSLPELISSIRTSAMLWGSLVADCEVTIQSPLITSRGNAITLKRGRLCLQKPGMVNLTVPASGSLQLRLVGDGQAYRVDMPCFRDAYTGAYGDPVVRTRNRIHFPPDDLAHAFDPLLLIAQGVPMVHHVGMMSYIESLELVEEPREQVQFASTVVFNRLRGQVVEIVKYEPDQTARVRMNYRALQLVSTGDEGQTTPIPYRITMSYLGEQAIIDILLSNIKLNEKLDPALFNVPAPAR